MNQLEKRSIALAGIAQCAYLVQKVAVGKSPSDKNLAIMIASLFEFSPQSTTDVFQNQIIALKEGTFLVNRLLQTSEHKHYKQVAKIIFSILHHALLLSNAPTQQSKLTANLLRAEQQAKHLGMTHPQLIATIADIYTEVFGKMRHRTKVAGSPTHLQQPHTQALIRTLLLCGIRSAFLWRQLGGRDWHFILKKRQLRASIFQLNKTIQAIEEPQWNTQH